MSNPTPFSKALHDLGLTFAEEILIKQYVKKFVIGEHQQEEFGSLTLNILKDKVKRQNRNEFRDEQIKALGEES